MAAARVEELPKGLDVQVQKNRRAFRIAQMRAAAATAARPPVLAKISKLMLPHHKKEQDLPGLHPPATSKVLGSVLRLRSNSGFG